MAHIERFTVHGLAAQERVVDRKLDRYINVFWGLNGTGKTSLLKILSAALMNDTDLLEGVPFDSAQVVFWDPVNEARLTRSIDMHQEIMPSVELLRDDSGHVHEVELDSSPSWSTVAVGGKIPTRVLSGPFEHTYLPISRTMSQTSSARRYLGGSARPRAFINDDYLDTQFADQVQAKWQSYTASANTRIRNIQQRGLASILALLFGGGRGPIADSSGRMAGSEAYGLVSRFLQEQGISLRFGEDDFIKRYEQDQDLRRVVSSIQEVTGEVEEALQPQHEFQSVIERLYSGNKQVFFDSGRTASNSLIVVANEDIVPLRSLSSGEKQLLRLLLEALSAGSTTVMIDEPELSMHVDWQQVLVASMRAINSDCQLLLATHSPEVMAEVPDRYVFEL